MIHYALRCPDAHEFDGWFRDSAAFDQQAEAGLIACPHCASTNISRGLMAPALPRKSNARPEPRIEPRTEPLAAAPEGAAQTALEPVPTTSVNVPALPDTVRVALQRLRAEVEKNADYVGEDFAEEARRIHNGEAAARAIYGETTEAQAEALAEDGIEVARIPWMPRADS